MRKRLKKNLLPNIFNTQITFKGKKLNSSIKINDTFNFEYKHDFVYRKRFPANICNNDYVGETDQRISERMMAHNCGDINSHLLKLHLKKSINVFKIKTLLYLAVVFRIMQ